MEAPDPGLLARDKTRDAIGGDESGRILRRLSGIPENPKQRRQFQSWELQTTRDIIKGWPTTRAALRQSSRDQAVLEPLAGAGLAGRSAMIQPRRHPNTASEATIRTALTRRMQICHRDIPRLQPHFLLERCQSRPMGKLASPIRADGINTRPA